jgi:hypothetical protein
MAKKQTVASLAKDMETIKSLLQGLAVPKDNPSEPEEVPVTRKVQGTKKAKKSAKPNKKVEMIKNDLAVAIEWNDDVQETCDDAVQALDGITQLKEEGNQSLFETGLKAGLFKVLDDDHKTNVGIVVGTASSIIRNSPNVGTHYINKNGIKKTCREGGDMKKPVRKDWMPSDCEEYVYFFDMVSLASSKMHHLQTTKNPATKANHTYREACELTFKCDSKGNPVYWGDNRSTLQKYRKENGLSLREAKAYHPDQVLVMIAGQIKAHFGKCKKADVTKAVKEIAVLMTDESHLTVTVK